MLTLMMQETEATLAGSHAAASQSQDGDVPADEAGDAVDGDEEEDAAWRNGDNYERLLALGHALGDVKKDRWRSRATVITRSII